MNTEDVIAGYLKLRREKEAIEARAKAELAEVKEKMEVLENYILRVLNESGADSIKVSGLGTAYLSLKSYASVADRVALRAFIEETGEIDLLNMAVNKTALQEYMAANDGRVPPGVNYKTEREVVIRKA